jgi:hypothetical protein
MNEERFKGTKAHELLWVYAKGSLPGAGAEMDGLDMLRAVCNSIIVLGEVDLKNHSPEAIRRMIDTLATVTHMIHTETNLLRKDHGLASLTPEDIAAAKKGV